MGGVEGAGRGIGGRQNMQAPTQACMLAVLLARVRDGSLVQLAGQRQLEKGKAY